MANKINHLIDAYRRLNRQSADIVLATIIESFGSTYQKAGANMLIAQDGELTGLLGGGCFERDLVEKALQVFETGIPKTVFYDMRSSADVIWGLGLGCNGAVRVLLQLLKAEDGYKPLNIIADSIDANTTGVLVTIYESVHPNFQAGNSIFLSEPELDNASQPAAASFPFMTPARQTLSQRRPRNESHFVDGHVVKVFYDLIQPPLHLLVLGAGVDAVPVVQCAKSLGWRVTVADHRPGHIKQERFLQADHLLHLDPEELADHMELDQFNAIVLMTHNIESDERYLKAIANSRIPFIGLLGPAQRKDRLLQSLGVMAARITDRIFGPVGLDIGAETPEEIAVSIMAGIHAAMNRRDGKQLSSKSQFDLSGKTMNASIDNVYAIILAAGSSHRMGKIKQLLEWQNQSLLEHAIQNARSLLNERVIVVLGAHSESIQAAVDLDSVTATVNSDWQEGIASSIRAGVQALPVTASAALILLCDQPLIRPAFIRTLLTGWQNEPARIVACQYNDSIGVPALFPAEFFRPLLELKGDQGAKRLLLEFSDRVLKISFPEAEFDIDTTGDFNHLTRHYSAKE